ncbi:unnamed protein product, partial [Brenthis ino]
MDQSSANKHRTPSRCREWERQRRMKFNDAISKLGELVKSINKTNSASSEDVDNVQYPKIEIVQKAIICLTNFVQEKTQLKAEILALEIKLEGVEKKKPDRRDVSLQVAIGVNKNSQNSKYVKLLMLQKSKQKNVKEKEINKISEKKKKNSNIVNKFPPKLPKLLPLSHMKKENTIVMLPATPYIFPQRPVIFPQPPTFVLVDTNLQPLNKSTTIPIVNRNTNDITKTTMVNVLPISAYSHSLSEKNKRNTAKPRTSVTKRGAKRVNQINKKVDSNKSKTNKQIETKSDENKITDQEREVTPDTQAGNIETDKTSKARVEKTVTEDSDKKELSSKPDLTVNNVDVEPENKIENSLTEEIHVTDKMINIPKCSESSTVKEMKKIPEPTPQIPVTVEKPITITNSMDATPDKIPPDKPIQDYKNKDSKIQNILDPSICENVVDGGNARLELAEEFLAASPTAAFLMSFPLVSGNRADSPAEEPQANHAKEIHHRNETLTQPVSYFEKPNLPQNKNKPNKPDNENNIINPVSKSSDQPKYHNNNKSIDAKISTSVSSLVTNENPFLNLPLPSIIPSSCTLADASFTIDFDCSVSKSVTTQVTTYSTTSNNIFYKGDPFNTVKSSIYSTSTISSGHEYNTLSLYPCAMENYSNKNKTDFTNVEDNLMKINNSRLTYDIDLGWSHKGFDFVNCTTSANTFHKDNILTNTSTPFSTAYNPFNPEFHVPLVPSSNKKNSTNKPNAFPEQITTFYNQGTNLWSEDVSSIHTNSNVSKNFISKQQNYFPTEHLHSNINLKTSAAKPFETKQINENATDVGLKPSSVSVPSHQLVEKYTKKSPSKMHINWMTSEIRPMQNTCNQSQAELKESIKAPYSQNEQVTKKNIQSDGNYFPINMHHFPSQPNHEELHVWPTTRPAGTTEISMEPPPINLPTLVGDLALGPHDKKKNEALNRTLPHTDLQNCGNFLSVTQLMNRSNENLPLRPNGVVAETQKSISSKQNISHALNEGNRKTRLDNHSQICYGFSDSKVSHPYENVNHFSQPKAKPNKPDKSSKSQKNSYSAEALIRGGTTCSQKLHDNSSTKFMMPQKYNDFNITQDSGVAQVSHFPPILDYTDNSYGSQQFSGTTLYNSTTNTISNSFYSNFMPGSSNLMTSNYASGPFPTDFVDYNQSAECNNYTNHKYDSKLRNNAAIYQEKESSNYKTSRRETAAKHKLECSKKESSKKYQSKRAKLGNEVDEWNDTSHIFWQNKAQSKKHQNMMSEELAFPNYMGNQMPSQYQPDFFNSHLMQSNIQNVGSNGDRTLSGIPVASRANFNLSALFPEITMKVQ